MLKLCSVFVDSCTEVHANYIIILLAKRRDFTSKTELQYIGLSNVNIITK